MRRFVHGDYIDASRGGLKESNPLPLRKVFFLEHDHFGTNPSHELKDKTGKMLLYEHLSRESRSAGFCLFDSHLSLPPVDNESYSRHLIETIDRSQIEYYSLTESYENILEGFLVLSRS